MASVSYRLLLVDDDPVFRLGLRSALQSFPEVVVVAEAETGPEALQQVEVANPIDLIVLEWNLGRGTPGLQAGFQFTQDVHQRYPELPILLVSTPPTAELREAVAVRGYCPKGTAIAELVTAMGRVLQGGTYFAGAVSQAPNLTPVRAQPPATLTPWGRLRKTTRLSGLQQIEAAIAEVTAQMQATPSWIDRAVLAGRRRELVAARWVVNQLLAVPPTPAAPPPPITVPPPLVEPSPPPAAPLATTAVDRLTYRALQAGLWDAIAARIQTSLQNLTEVPLEIDILREEKKRELLYVVLRQLETLLEELRLSDIQPTQLVAKRDAILRDLWQAVIVNFFGKYSTLEVPALRSGTLTVEVVPALLNAAPVVEAAILDKIPLTLELMAHLLFQTPLVVDNRTAGVGSPEAMLRVELLLQNLIIQVANAVMQPFLNQFADVEAIKQTFYDRRLVSTREIERFRNNLSWKYRLDQYFGEPKAIFESQFWLLTLEGRGIKRTPIYAPRNQELDALSGVQLTVTLALEVRDAIAPRLRAAASFLGSGLVYILTDVVGRGLGLIGRGILQGIGNAWQDSRPRRDSGR